MAENARYLIQGRAWWNRKTIDRPNYILEKSTLGIGVFTKLLNFGIQIGDTDIAIVACRLYREALAPTTRGTYKTGVRHLQKFAKKYPKLHLPSVDRNSPSRLTLSLVFFAAYLFEVDSINLYSTIWNYMSHVTQFYVKKGYPKKSLKSELLKTVKLGIKRCMPPKADSRVAFLLIHYHLPSKILGSRSFLTRKTTAANFIRFFRNVEVPFLRQTRLEEPNDCHNGRKRSYPVKS